MKKFILNLALFMALLLPLSALAAESNSGPAGNPVELLTGKVWQESKPENKQAWLFGVDTAVAVEHAVADKMQQQKGKRKGAFQMSPFVSGWIEAFGKGDTRKEIIGQVDQWYAANPDKLERPVMDVIWYEIVQPRIAAK